MASFYGADVEQLDALAVALEREGQTLEELLRRLDARLRSVNWSGPDGENARSIWISRSFPQLLRAAEGLQTAGLTVRRNSADQRLASGGPASGVSAAAFSTAISSLSLDAGTRAEIEAMVGEFLAGALSLTDFAMTLMDLKGLDVPGVATVLGPAMVALGAHDFVTAVSEGDAVGAVTTFLSTSVGAVPWVGQAVGLSGVAATAAAGFGVVGLGIGLLGTWVQFGIPTTYDAQTATFEQATRDMFGPNVAYDPTDHVQAAAIAQRYELPWGPFAMISDKMRSAAPWAQ